MISHFLRPIAKNWGEINRAKIWLLAITAILQAGDVLTTNAVLAFPGAAENNRIMAATMDAFGSYWWVPKILVLPTVFYVLGRYQRLWPAVIVLIIYSVVVGNNISNMLAVATRGV